MKKFILQLILFCVASILAGEIIVRAFDLTVDVPKSYRAESGMIKYYPGQEGKYAVGSHRWKINEFGYAGTVPSGTDNLITLLGDSYIENFMNPTECHQDAYLKSELPQYNFIEAGRATASFLEMLEMSKAYDSLNPFLHVFYVKNSDFLQSIDNGKGKKNDKVSYNLKTGKIQYAKYEGSTSKDILYNFKFFYYCYRNIWHTEGNNGEIPDEKAIDKLNREEIVPFMDYVKKNYDAGKMALVFYPESSKELMDLCKSYGFKVMVIETDNHKSWQFEHDAHWTCYGHKQVALQVKKFIEELAVK